MWRRSARSRRASGAARIPTPCARCDVPQAVRLCVESLGHNRAGGERLGVAAALVALAPIADSLGHPAYAVQLLSKAEALASSIGGQLLPFEAEQYETTLSRLRAQLDPAAWTRAWEDGRRLSLDEAVQTVENFVPRTAEKLPSVRRS